MLLHIGQNLYLFHRVHFAGTWVPLWMNEKLLASPSFPFSSSVSLNIVHSKDGCLVKHLLMKDLASRDKEFAFYPEDRRKPLASLEK